MSKTTNRKRKKGTTEPPWLKDIKYTKDSFSLEELYGIVSKKLPLKRVYTHLTKKALEVFDAPIGEYIVHSEFEEFTTLCPKTNQPDFGYFQILYIPDKLCIELKSLKYYLNSFRNEGHFHEEVVNLIHQELKQVLKPKKILIIVSFNTRGGISTEVSAGDLE